MSLFGNSNHVTIFGAVWQHREDVQEIQRQREAQQQYYSRYQPEPALPFKCFTCGGSCIGGCSKKCSRCGSSMCSGYSCSNNIGRNCKRCGSSSTCMCPRYE